MRIAFFGGAFDPPHLGHLSLAKAVLAEGLTDLVLFAPSYAPPHKQGQELASFADRVAMLETMIAGYEGMQITSVEQQISKVPSYTIDIMNELARLYPNDKLQMLIGGDSLAELHTWKQPEELIERWEIIVYPRSSAKITYDLLEANFPPKIAAKLSKTIVSGRLFVVSSTEVREQLESGGSPIVMVPDGVLDYIKKHKLYRRIDN